MLKLKIIKNNILFYLLILDNMVIQNNQLFKTVSFSQGEQFLKFQKKKIQNHSYINSDLTKINSYDEPGSYLGQSTLHSTDSKSMAKNQTIIEGFSGGAGAIFSGMYDTPNKPVSDVNSAQLAEVKLLTKEYNTKLIAYQKAYKKYINDTGTFTKSMPGSKGDSKQYAGKNIKLEDDSIGYITGDGFFKYYNDSTWNALQKLVTNVADAKLEVSTATKSLNSAGSTLTNATAQKAAQNIAKKNLASANAKLKKATNALNKNTCPKDISATVQASFDGKLTVAGTKINTDPPMYTSTPMTSSYDCNVDNEASNSSYNDNFDAALSSDKQNLDDAYSDLMNTKSKIDSKLSKLQSSDSSVVGMLGDEISQLKNDISQYEKVQKNVKSEELRSMDVRGMYEDSGLNVISRNTQFLVWSILAIGIVTVGVIKTSKR